MKRVLSILLVLILLTGCNPKGNGMDHSNEDLEMDYTTAIYYSPHADDEVLSMGSGILHNLALGKEVIVVLLSKGLASNAINIVNEKLEKEGHSPITPEEFGQARVEEFRNSVTSLGVSEDNIYIYDLDDGQFTSNDVASIINDFVDKYPNALHNAMSYNDPHSDHAATGQAVSELIENGDIQHGLYYLPIQEHNNMDFEGVYTVPEDRVDAFEQALKAYGKWSPEDKSYSIGYLSVRNYFELAEKSLEGRWHH
ncbi:PIG-L deacetylase family protein [Sporosarcina sp. 6E9]|uniref:PIG-L deacetylase family protein n=1 Tax=Sporosarcina sp. 6E9 TaxID=2819235 RepID=UPI001B3040BA|nr:PIG-L family deacetylase [Sporosarcina sp. 6E9]